MPQKRNPVSAVLLVAASRRSPQLVATLFGALESVDERPPGAWHAEWAGLRSLLDLGVGSAGAAASTLAGVTVDADRMLANLALTGDAIHAESAKHGQPDGTATAVAVAGPIVDAAIQRFRSIQ
jgi:3-carboxy-cis,cis-muconate cycloisomerase